MAHYFDVISCGIKQMHAQFSPLFGLHTEGWGGEYFSNFWVGIRRAAGTLEPLAYTRAHSMNFATLY